MMMFAIGWMRDFRDSEHGVTAIEYGLIAALVSVVIIGSLSLVGAEVQTTFNTWTTAVQNAIQNAGT